MDTLESIKKRIQSIAGTRQITRSMRLISTSRVQRARLRMEANMPFLKEARRLMQVASAECGGERAYTAAGNSRRAAVIVINGDHGLCGGYNINVNRRAAAFIKTLASDPKIIAIGTKARDFCRRRYADMLAHSVTGVSDNAVYEDAAEVAFMVCGWYANGEIQEIHLVYTEYVSMLTQTATDKRLLPIDGSDADNTHTEGGYRRFTRCEPHGGGFHAKALELYIASGVYGAILEAALCEHSARVVSMDSAAKNSDEMIEALTLKYNQARQDAITQEIIEVVGGAGAVSANA